MVHVLQVDSRSISSVQHFLARIVIETFYPQVPSMRQRNDKKALFPGYLFMRLDLPRGHWRNFRYLPGIRTFVMADEEPCSVDDRIVDQIRHRVDSWSAGPSSLRPGNPIVVTSGPFFQIDGTFCERLSGAQRVAVLLQMHREVRVELPCERVKALPEGGTPA